MIYTVTIISGMSMYTAYAGQSSKAAGAHIDTARNVFIMTKGTGSIQLRVNGALEQTWGIEDGLAQVEFRRTA